MSAPGGNDHERFKDSRVVEIPMTSTFKRVWILAVLVVQKSLQFVAVVAAAVSLAAPVHADADTDFANQLHVYGVYGQRDYNAWLGKITCNRLGNGIDADAYKSAAFLSKNLPRGTTTAQTWQFLNSAINTYCPDQMPVLTSAAGPRQ
jgi:Protein of unknown function (DUF732)